MSMHINPGALRRKNAGERRDDAVEMTEVVALLKARDAEIKAFAEKASAEIKDTGKIANETKAALEKLSTEGASLGERLQAVEQKMSRRTFGNETERKSIGAQFTESDEFKALSAKGVGAARMSIKASTITSATTDAAGSAGDAIVADRLPGIQQPAQRAFTIRNLLMPGRTSSNSVEFIKETGYTNSAAAHAENATVGAQSDIKLDLETVPVRNIGHFFVVSEQVLSDVPLLESYINGRAIWGLKYAEETELLTGDGTGQHIDGLLHQATAFNETTYTKSGDTLIDTVRRAALQARVAEYTPTFIVLNPVDWADIETTKVGTGDGRYLLVPFISEGAQQRLWRLNVVETSAMTSGQFLVGASMGATVFDREDATIEVGTQDGTNFQKRLVTIRATERLALAVTRPESFVYGQFELGLADDSPPTGINA